MKQAVSTLFLVVILALACNDSNPYRQGGNLYRMHCESCHLANGQGLGQLIPPLAGSDYLVKHREEVACVIRYGMEGPVTVNDTLYNSVMAGIPELSDVQINNIINYINHAWGNDYGASNAREVSAQLKRCPSQ